METLELSVVIPCYDEMANLRKGVLDKVEHYLNRHHPNYEVLVVDDGSKDGSIEFVEQFVSESPKFRLIKNSHLGKAGAVTAGMLKAQGKFVLFADMDQATPIEEVEKLLPYIQKSLPAGRQDYDIVIGSRSGTRKGAPWTRLLMARAMMVLRTAIVGLQGISDTQCGFKMFRKDAAQRLFARIQDFHHGFKTVTGSSVSAGFDVELLYLAQKMGYKIKEVPVEWLYVESRRVSPIRDSIDGLIDLFRIRVNSIRGKYN